MSWKLASVLYNYAVMNRLLIRLEFSVKLKDIFAAPKLLKQRTLLLVHYPKSVERSPEEL